MSKVLKLVRSFIFLRHYQSSIYTRILGEPCDPRLLTNHYKKSSPVEHGLDFKSESAAIYILVREGVKNILSPFQ